MRGTGHMLEQCAVVAKYAVQLRRSFPALHLFGHGLNNAHGDGELSRRPYLLCGFVGIPAVRRVKSDFCLPQFFCFCGCILNQFI